MTVVRDDPPLSAVQLDGLDGVLTTCHIAISETGTIVLDGRQGRGALSLVPDYHLVVVLAEQVVATVPDVVRPKSWISGPAPPATSNCNESKACTAPADSKCSLSPLADRGGTGAI